MQFNKRTISALTIVLSGIFVVSLVSSGASGQSSMEDMKSTVVRDSSTVLLGLKSIPAGDYIHLYDSTPYMIMNGHVAAKLPCDVNSESPLQIMIGQAPNLNPADLELISEFSKPGKYCLYHVDLESTMDSMITDIVIQNPTDKSIRMPTTATVVIGVNEIMPGAEDHN